MRLRRLRFSFDPVLTGRGAFASVFVGFALFISWPSCFKWALLPMVDDAFGETMDCTEGFGFPSSWQPLSLLRSCLADGLRLGAR